MVDAWRAARDAAREAAYPTPGSAAYARARSVWWGLEYTLRAFRDPITRSALRELGWTRTDLPPALPPTDPPPPHRVK